MNDALVDLDREISFVVRRPHDSVVGPARACCDQAVDATDCRGMQTEPTEVVRNRPACEELIATIQALMVELAIDVLRCNDRSRDRLPSRVHDATGSDESFRLERRSLT